MPMIAILLMISLYTYRPNAFDSLLSSTCRFLPPLPALPCRLVPPCPPAAPTTCRRFARYKMCMWLSTIVPFVAECMWLSTIVPFYLLQVLETSPCREVLPKFRFDTIMFLLLQERLLQRPRLITL